MTILMVILCLVVLVLLVLVAAVTIDGSTLSSFELERRKSRGDQKAIADARRERLRGDVISLQQAVGALLFVLLLTLVIITFGWPYGILISILIALEYRMVAGLNFVQHFAQKIYNRSEAPILRFVERFPFWFQLLRSTAPISPRESHIDSREELAHLIANAHTVLSSDEKKLLVHSLEFDQRPVKDSMTPRGVIDSVNKKELLGPLVLDDLHQTGHSRFPVIDGDIDHVVGMLYIQDLLTINSKQRSTTAEKAMEPRVFYIHEQQTLAHALAAFLKTHHHLFVVVNEFRETVGLLSLEDVIEALLGRKIVDEFDLHDDLRAVAARNPRKNNEPKDRRDM